MCLGWMLPLALAATAVGLTMELTPSLGECLRILCSELCDNGLAASDVPDVVHNSIESASHLVPDPSEVDPWKKCHNVLLSRAAHSYHDTESTGNPRYFHLDSWEGTYHDSEESFLPSL